MPKVVLRILAPLASERIDPSKNESLVSTESDFSNGFPLCCMIRIKGIQAKHAFTVAISLALASLNLLHIRCTNLEDSYKAFPDFARDPGPSIPLDL